MKKSMIEEVYFSNESICEQIEPTKEYKKFSDEAFRLYDKLSGILTEEQKELFEDFVNKNMDERAEAEIMHFKKGFKTGLLLAMECSE